MNVYELIQELTRFNPYTEVRFPIADSKFTCDTEAEFDRANENDTQEVTVDVEIDEDLEFEVIRDYENVRHSKSYIQIDLKY